MRHRTKRSIALRFSARLVVFGLWSVFFALFVVYFSVQLMGTMTTFDAGVLGAEAGMNLDGMLVESVVMLYRGGFITLGVGGTLMTLGGTFLVSAMR